ncbi:RNA methyltransferase [Rufibacter roseus]|uniref:RNA methyltransferase n=1 Tax=Rufibacter roseus TaxID=1567108 RepID=A0ABW2DII7_9BACT|nr:RNA methyltransferase [Rufibacter roseus]
MDELQRDSLEDFKNKQKNPLVLVLDNVRSLHNVGSAFRTADAFAVEKIYLCGITGTPPNKEIHKTALGATESVEWSHAPSTLEAVLGLKEQGYSVWAIEQAEGSTTLTDFSPAPDGKYAFVFGNEVFGVEDEVMKAADGVLEIPQFGTKHSLNVSVTVGVIVWDVLSKLLSSRG